VTDMTDSIAALAARDLAVRERAAEELYRLGREPGDAVVAGWRRDREFALLLTGPPTVGIAVRPETFERIRAAWGNPPLAEVPAEHDAEEFELHAGDARLDIISTRGGGGAIARFLEKSGEGIQQVEYTVKDVDRATARLTALGEKPLYPVPRPGADGSRVNFILATAPGGGRVLIELVEVRRSGLADGGWGE
jgi:hypothetical protein